eukprot:scaffold141807_cov32-Tisochrysis_lutea.AAC.6
MLVTIGRGGTELSSSKLSCRLHASSSTAPIRIATTLLSQKERGEGVLRGRQGRRQRAIERVRQ